MLSGRNSLLEFDMKTLALAIGLATILCACGGSKITEEQCNAILRAEIRVSLKDAVATGSMDDLLGPAKYGSPIACRDGTTHYTRGDYECIAAAKSDGELKTCLDTAHTRIDRS